jgi:hypothetical protein
MALPTANDIKRMTKWAVPRLPAAPNGGRSIESSFPEIVRDLALKFHLESRVEWDSYGQGYASYVDAWFFQDNPAFRLPALSKGEKHYTGLYVLLCRDAPYFVMGEGARSWTDRGGSSYMPGFNGIDDFTSRAVKDVAEKVSAYLSTQGLVRLNQEDMAEELPEDLHFDTNLIDGKHRLYDALFFWYD